MYRMTRAVLRLFSRHFDECAADWLWKNEKKKKERKKKGKKGNERDGVGNGDGEGDERGGSLKRVNWDAISDRRLIPR